MPIMPYAPEKFAWQKVLRNGSNNIKISNYFILVYKSSTAKWVSVNLFQYELPVRDQYVH